MADGTQALHLCLKELAALAAGSNLSQPRDIADTLAGVLCRTLPVAFAYVRLSGEAGSNPVDAASTPAGTVAADRVRELALLLEPMLSGHSEPHAPVIADPFEGGTRQLATHPLGRDGEYGVAATAWHQPPGPTDQLVLAALINQATAALQHLQIEDRLRRTESELADFFENAPVGLHWVEPGGIILRVNRAELDLLGYSPDEYVGHHIAEFHADKEVIADILRRLRDGDELHAYEARMRCKDGTIKDVAVSSNGRWAHGQVIKALCFTRDVSDRKRVEQALRRQSNQFATLVEHIPDIVARLDRDLRYLYIGPAVHAITGRPAHEYIGKPRTNQGLAPDVAEARERVSRKVFETGETQIFEFPIQTPAGERFLECRFIPEFAADGSVDTLMTLTRDVTERKLAEERLRESDRRKDEFLATLAHELRNPLAPIRTGLQVLKMANGDPATMNAVCAAMERQTLQLITLVDDLMDVSRITRGKLHLRLARLELADIVHSAVETSRPQIDERRHALTLSLPDAPLHVDGDPFRLSQVLSNLLNNAAKFTPAGGRIQLSAERAGGEIVVTVEDNGIGITADMLDRVFEMFTQIDRPLEKGQTGLGIGLTLVKSLVEMHGGSVRVRSEGENRGTTFTVCLPIATRLPEADSGPEATAEPPALREARRVLVVDDNEAAADMLAMMVEMLGHEVRTASDGDQALQVAEEFHPEVVLMDLRMPKVNGYEAATRMRATAWGKSATLIALTGWGQEAAKRRTEKAGFDHHLVKPADPETLRAILADPSTVS